MARFLSTVLLLVSAHVCLSASVQPADVDTPHSCRGLQCPQFTTIHSSEEYEEREYSESKWVSTEIMSMEYGSAVRTGFLRLFRYIKGNNDQEQGIEMTAPVAVRVIPGQGPTCESNFTVSFFIPADHSANPPTPTDPQVFFSTIPAHRVYVKTFGGFASQEDWISAAAELVSALDSEQSYDSSHYYTAGYNGPFTIFNRRNEVWFIAN